MKYLKFIILFGCIIQMTQILTPCYGSGCNDQGGSPSGNPRPAPTPTQEINHLAQGIADNIAELEGMIKAPKQVKLLQGISTNLEKLESMLPVILTKTGVDVEFGDTTGTFQGYWWYGQHYLNEALAQANLGDVITLKYNYKTGVLSAYGSKGLIKNSNKPLVLANNKGSAPLLKGPNIEMYFKIKIPGTTWENTPGESVTFNKTLYIQVGE